MSMTPADFHAALPRLEPKLRAFVADSLRNPSMIDDVVQETLLRGIQHRTQLRDETRLYPWLKTIARRILARELRREKPGTLERLWEQSQAARATADENWLDRHDETLRLLAVAQDDDLVLLATAMSACLGMRPAEIALYLGVKADTLSRQMRRVRNGLKKSGSPPLTAASTPFFVNVARNLCNAALAPMSGNQNLNSALAREAHALLKLLHRREPDNPHVVFHLMMTAFVLASVFQDSHWHPIPVYFRDWKRDWWDPDLWREGLQWSDWLQHRRKSHSAILQAQADWWRLIFSAAGADAVDWKKAWQLKEHADSLMGRTPPPLHAAMCLYRLRGARAAADYISRQRKGMHLRDYRKTYKLLGVLYHEAGRWAPARANLKKYLRWPCNDMEREQIQRLLADCQNRLQTRTKK